MRVLFVPKEFPSSINSQSGIFILRRAQAMQARGHDVRVLRFVPHAPSISSRWRKYTEIAAHETIEGIPVHTVRTLVPPRMIGMEYVPALMMPALSREIRNFEPDVLHASFLLPCGDLVSRQREIPSIVTAHGIDAYKWPNQRPGLKNASRRAVLSATEVTAVSGYIAECLQSFAPRNIHVIWNGAEERLFFPRDRAASRHETGLPQERPIALYAGNVYREKGIFDLLAAFAAIAPEERPLLVTAGTGVGHDEFCAQAKELAIEVRALGRVAHERVAALVGAADFFILPSWYEGLPNVICEAMLSARALVSTTVGGVPEIVQNEHSGLLVAPRDPESLSTAIRRLATDPALRERLAANARAFALQHLTWRHSAAKYEAVYEEALERRQRGVA